jgi:hypothetical protein
MRSANSGVGKDNSLAPLHHVYEIGPSNGLMGLWPLDCVLSDFEDSYCASGLSNACYVAGSSLRPEKSLGGPRVHVVAQPILAVLLPPRGSLSRH